MKISIITAFPEFFNGSICSLLKKASDKRIINFNVIDIKEYGIEKYKKIDDYPFGGGCGLILRADVVQNVLESNFNVEDFRYSKSNFRSKSVKNKTIFILPSPRGRKFTQNIARKLTQFDEMIFLCNRYEGVDQRIIDYYQPLEVSVGDYILMGGETASMCVIESVSRLIQNVIGNYE